MIKLEQITEILKQLNREFTNVQLLQADPSNPYNFVCCSVSNNVNPERRYSLGIHRIADKQILSICIISIAQVRAYNSTIPPALARINTLLSYGHLETNSEGLLNFTVNHACRGDDDNDPPPDVLEQVLIGMVEELREIEMIMVFCAMLDSRISKQCANSILRILFPEWGKSRLCEEIFNHCETNPNS